MAPLVKGGPLTRENLPHRLIAISGSVNGGTGSKLFITNFVRSFGNAPRFSNTFYADDLIIEKSEQLNPKPADDDICLFGAHKTDHILKVEYDKHNGGWQRPRIVPSADL